MAAGVQNATDGAVESPAGVSGVIPFKATVTVPATSLETAGDDVLLFKFPPNSYFDCHSLLIYSTALDTSTEALRVDVGIGDVDGAIDSVLINDTATTAFPAVAGVDFCDATVTTKWLDSGGKYLIMSVVTGAATAAAGTVAVEGLFAPGLVPIVAE